ncbi:DUF533 domain-containing protein [Vulgatibacter sp.]|uniref:DUF533 domain-containing protein n=1 Tax=Vulgatibacter sp. TaxID=1971226 RepID=UPI00356B2AE3
MELAHAGWLTDLIGRILAGYRPEEALSRLRAAIRGDCPTPAAPRVRALRHLEEELRRSGLVYGSPKLPARVTQGQRLDRAEALFLAVLAGEIFLALDIARIFGVPFDRQRTEAELTLLLAAAAGRPDLAEEVRKRALARYGTRRRSIDSLQEAIGEALLERQPPVTGDTVFDLPLHNGLVFGEARVVGHLAIEWYGRGRFDPVYAERLNAAVDRERAALMQALLALSLAHHPLTDGERRVVRRELRKLRLPRSHERQVRAALEKPLSPADLAERIRSRTIRRFVTEQVYLAAIVDGTVDDVERRFLGELRLRFGIDEDEMQAIAAQVGDYFYDPTDVHDAFEVRAAGASTSEKLVDRIAREIEENLDRILLEARETGDLFQLLGRAARGAKLSPEERARAREQLIDLAKVVPSLAIISAPGGMLIFAALLKVLPFNLLPSSFQRREQMPPHLRPPRVPLAARPAARR